jgi:hypothetical protein
MNSFSNKPYRWAFCEHQIKGTSAIHPDKLAITKHSISQGHPIQFHNPSIPTTQTRHIDEAIDIEPHAYKVNKEGDFCFSIS